MARNLAARNWDMVGYDVDTTPETSVIIPERILRFVALQCTTSADVYIARVAGQTGVANNRWTIKADQILVLEDIAMESTDDTGIFFYARGSADDLYLEVLYASG